MWEFSYWTVTSSEASSNSSRAIAFTFRLILFGKAWTPLSLLARGYIVTPQFFYKKDIGIK